MLHAKIQSFHVTDGGRELEAGVRYHKWMMVSGGSWEPEVQAVGQCEDKGKAGWIGSQLVVEVRDQGLCEDVGFHSVPYPKCRVDIFGGERL